MGVVNTREQRKQTLQWVDDLDCPRKIFGHNMRLSSVKQSFNLELKNYFALCCLARLKNEDTDLASKAEKVLFNVRTIIEKSIQGSLLQHADLLDIVFAGFFYGTSNKQGTSVRMPLTTCIPTKLCKSACYAHDVLDAAPATVVRGAVNGTIARLYEDGNKKQRACILDKLKSHTIKAIKMAKSELDNLYSGYSRRPHIRFSHVGEMAAFPDFTNALGLQVKDLSDGCVDCVVYTRHKNVNLLDSKLLIINYTFDASTKKTYDLLPDSVRPVYSAFGGKLCNKAAVNFLEHHRWTHMKPIGCGKICPATLPETKVRSCDAVQCNLCFVPNIAL